MIKPDYPSVLLIYTGGTIGMIENPETGALEAFNFDQLQENVPELKRFNYRISSYQFNPPIDSSDMEPALWAKLVKIIQYNYDNFDGFVILHGTDTMAYTASALSFMLENLSTYRRKGKSDYFYRNSRCKTSGRNCRGTGSLHFLREPPVARKPYDQN